MARKLNLHRQHGFTIIEALFSAIVLSIGLLALAGFQAVALQDSTAVKMRMAATNLAQEKLDDLKSFSRLSGTSTQCGAGIFCYTEIGANTGGKEEAGGSQCELIDCLGLPLCNQPRLVPLACQPPGGEHHQ